MTAAALYALPFAFLSSVTGGLPWIGVRAHVIPGGAGGCFE